MIRGNSTFKSIVGILTFLLCAHFATAQSSSPILILDVQGKKCLKAKSPEGEKIKLMPGTAITPGVVVKMKPGTKFLALQDKTFQWIEGEGDVTVKPLESEGSMSLRNFEPLFAEYMNANFQSIMYHQQKGHLDIKDRPERGNAWVGKGENMSGWGVTGNMTQGGWGVTGNMTQGGWGVTGNMTQGGWGVTGNMTQGGWGVTGNMTQGGWGVTGNMTQGGWGVTGNMTQGGYGKTNPIDQLDWGVTGNMTQGGWGVTGNMTQGGWSIDDMKILPITPSGNLQSKKYEISWTTKKGIEAYLFCVFNRNLEVVYHEIVNSANIQLDFKQFENDSLHYWQVFAKNENAISYPVNFIVVKDGVVESLNERVASSSVYNNSDEAIKGIMMAVKYEDNEFYLDALNIYKNLLSNHKNNDIVRIAYAGFCIRYGEYINSKKIIEKI